MEDKTWDLYDMTETKKKSQEYMISMLRTKEVFPQIIMVQEPWFIISTTDKLCYYQSLLMA